MSRDPSHDLEDFRDALYARAELEAEKRSEEQSIAGRTARSSDLDRPRKLVGAVPGPDPRLDDSRGVLYDRDRVYCLRVSELRTLADLGKFRALGVEDLLTHVYSRDRDRMHEDLRHLLRQGLLSKGTFEGPENTPRDLVTLQKTGVRLLRANCIIPRDQAIYHGFVKPREANHDADLYLLYQKEAARIQAKGGRPMRIILDFELKERINRDFAQFGTEARKEIAAHHGLEVVRGKIPVPDLRIEYEQPDGELAQVDLELVTEHYRNDSIADKVRAGFSLYTPRGEADRLRRVLDQQELTAEILSL